MSVFVGPWSIQNQDGPRSPDILTVILTLGMLFGVILLIMIYGACCAKINWHVKYQCAASAKGAKSMSDVKLDSVIDAKKDEGSRPGLQSV